MARKLPSLNALRAFEAVARHLHFGNAAGELGVTPSAISHQVRNLEEMLGIALFDRSGPRPALTMAGRHMLPALREAFDSIARSIDQLDVEPLSGEVTIAAAPAISALRLSLLFGDYLAKHPHLSLRLLPVEKASSTVDLVISFGEMPIAGERVPILANLDYFPVCSPKLLNGPAPLGEPADLTRHVLIHEDDGRDWHRWLSAVGMEHLKFRQQMFYPNSAEALAAVRAGHGLAIGDIVLAGDDLREGTLIRPFAAAVPAPHPYYLILPAGRSGSRVGRELRDWLLRKFQAPYAQGE